MAGMGPPPKPAGTRARRNPAPQTTTLSASSRKGMKTPPWPLRADLTLTMQLRTEELRGDRLRGSLLDEVDARKAARLQQQLDESTVKAMVLEEAVAEQSAMELALWEDLWRTPQAAKWEWPRDVAQYVRLTVRDELAGDLDAGKEARQWSDRLGLNPMAMLRLRWEYERTDEAETRGRQRRERPTPAKAAGADPRQVLRAVK